MFPVYKKGERRDVKNYRGITSLGAISKLLELVVMDPLLSHCKQYLCGAQHGFIYGRSTASNLLCLTSHITESLAERAQTGEIDTFTNWCTLNCRTVNKSKCSAITFARVLQPIVFNYNLRSTEIQPC